MPIPVNDHDHITGEQYLAYLRAVAQQFDSRTRAYVRVVRLQSSETGFQLGTETRTGERAYQSQYVVLATGDMGMDNRLGTPGEDVPHVTHVLDDPPSVHWSAAAPGRRR